MAIIEAVDALIEAAKTAGETPTEIVLGRLQRRQMTKEIRDVDRGLVGEMVVSYAGLPVHVRAEHPALIEVVSEKP